MFKKEIVNDFLASYFSDCFGSIITGSAINSEMTETSDIDLLVFDIFLSRNYEEIFEFRGYQFHVVVTAVYLIHERLYEDIEKKHGLFTSLISNGRIIKDTDCFCQNLIRRTRSIYADPSLFTPKLESHQQQFLIQSLFIQLKSCKDYEEGASIIIELIRKVVDHHLLVADYWRGSTGKHLSRSLKTVNAELQKELISGYKKFILSKNKSAIIKSVNKYLEVYDVSNPNFIRSNNILKFSTCGSLLVTYKKVPSSEVFYNRYYSHFVKLSHGILNQEDFYAIRKLDTFKNEEIYYIIVKKGDNILKNRLLPRFRQTFYKNKIDQKNIGIEYSFNELQDSFSSQRYFFELKKTLFIEFQNYLSKNDYNSNQTSFHAIYLLVVYGLTLFSNLSLYASILTDICAFWLPKAFNFTTNNENHKVKSNALLLKYKKLYETNSKSKFNIYFSKLISDFNRDIELPQYSQFSKKLKVLIDLNKLEGINFQENIIPFCNYIDVEDTYNNMVMLDEILNVLGVPDSTKSYLVFNAKEIINSYLTSEHHQLEFNN